jgi:hypothetical protein
MQPALQLLSAGRLHAYELPPGWVCIAAVNPEDGDYQLNRLDPALRSRFMQVQVCADRALWLDWAVRLNIHPAILQTVRQHDGAFATTPPRSWAYASDFLHALRDNEATDFDLVRMGLRGYLPVAWALVVTEQLRQTHNVEMPTDAVLFGVDGTQALAALVDGFDREHRIDLATILASRIRNRVNSAWFADAAARGEVSFTALENLIAPRSSNPILQCPARTPTPVAPRRWSAAGIPTSDQRLLLPRAIHAARVWCSSPTARGECQLGYHVCRRSGLSPTPTHSLPISVASCGCLERNKARGRRSRLARMPTELALWACSGAA